MTEPARRLAATALCVLLLACASQNPPTISAVPTSTPTASQSELPTSSPTPTTVESPTPTSSAPPPTATPTTGPPGQLAVVKNVPYATTGDCGERLTECQQFVDVYAPSNTGPWPVAVMVHGRPRTPADMQELAKAVARSGAVVFNIDYRGVRPVVQEGWPEAVEDVACAVRFARSMASAYGGDASRLVLIGHSFGGYVGTLVALAGDKFNGVCLTPDVSALPYAWVGIDANCIVGEDPHPLWTTFYGGTREEVPGRWRKGDPLNHVGGNPGLIVRMIHERDDPIIELGQPRTVVRALREDGYDATLTVLEGDDHWGPLDVDTAAGQVSLDTILELLGIDD